LDKMFFGSGSPIDTAKKGNILTPLMITLNNRITGMLWDATARKIVRKENHKMLNEMYESLAIKLYVVYLFNWSYPFIYIAFVKKFNEGCLDQAHHRLFKASDPGFDPGFCVDELKSSVVSFYVISAVVDFMILLVGVLKPAYQISTELKNAKEDEKYTYVEVQAKLAEPNLVLDDMTVFVVQFSFMCAFTYAVPQLSFYAFVYNCTICNWYLWSHLRLQKRCEPIRCPGMPIWNSLMRFSMFFSVVINAGMAAFVVNPMASLKKEIDVVNKTENTWNTSTVTDTTSQLYFFVGLENALFLMIALMMVIVPDMPLDAARRNEYNDDNEDKLLDPTKRLELVLHTAAAPSAWTRA